MPAQMNGFVLLDAPQLKKLADLIHKQEIIRIKNQKQPDVHTFKQLCADSKAARDTVIDALEKAERVYDELRAKANEEARVKVAEDHFHYVKNSANNALQNVRNFSIRMDYAKKISAHSEEIMHQMLSMELDTADFENLADYCADFREDALAIARTHMRPTARHYSEWLKENGIGFDQLVSDTQAKLNKTGFRSAKDPDVFIGEGTFGGQFENLQEFQKIAVYEEVVRDSGRAMPKINITTGLMGALGVGVILLGIGLLVWDIYQSAHPVETAVRGVLETALGVGGAMLGEAFAVTVASGMLSAEAESTALFVAMASFVGGIAGAFIVGALVAVIVGAIVGTAGRSVPLTPVTEGLKPCLIELPDGRALANLIHSGAHDDATIVEASG
ncbi:hypothetical protein HYH02_004971 [Chlamydomonas schloesseri]|uniref:Uncharacterized protein n=1 Tax=Chlamydomonas schloesseri TaxID=2026947 RepID=A0A836B8D1_9CHLO|nr:hypothetical protein HYH02_004971 [Chlamydomonas schloesseri]|eukprot:KAG2450470.1 hypothetical protein HYH02_004971 [Chlamydomonas schloesseri]